MSDQKLISTIMNHEGLRQFAYQDTLGYWTIGIGRCVDKKKGKGISKDEAMYLLGNDISDCSKSLSEYHWYSALDYVRQGVMIELCFNLGLNGFLGFKNTIAAISEGNYESAVEHLLDSKWATQIGKDRINNICYRLKNGSYPDDQEGRH